MAEIKVLYEELETAADTINTCATDLDGIIAEAGNIVNAIAGGWEGLAANSFMADYSAQKENLAKLGEAVQGLGGATKQIAQSWRDLEGQLAARG